MKVKRVKNWSIFSKIISFSILFSLGFAAAYEFYFLPKIEENIYENKIYALKNVLDATCSILENLQSKVDKGQLSLDSAKAIAFNTIQNERFHEKDYLFVNDLDGYCRVSRNNANVGKYVGNDHDDAGNYTHRIWSKISEEKGSGSAIFHYKIKDEMVSKLYCFELFRPWKWIVVNGMLIKDIQSEVSIIREKFLIALLIIMISGVIIAYFFASNISKPIKLLAKGAEKVSRGDYSISIDINSKNEIGDLSGAFNIMVGNIRKSIDEINRKEEEARQAAESAQEAQKSAEEQSKYLTESTNKMLSAIDKFANGDLTIVLEAKGNDDVGRLFNGFNVAIKKIREMLSKIHEAVSATASASNEITSSTEQMAAGSMEQTQQASEVASAVEQMTQTIMGSSQNAKFAADSALENGDKARLGGEIVIQTINGMNRIAEVVTNAALTVEQLGTSSNQIGEIVQVIDDIADQTNLLALNAAIEAARAGEQGRGFAVVADEVRKLAERTTKATKEIADMIRKIQNDTILAVSSIKQGTEEVEKGKDLAQKAGEALQEIIVGTEKGADLIKQLAVASEQQSNTSEQMSKNIEGINTVIQESSLGIREIPRAADDLSRLTQNLQELIAQFRISKGASQKLIASN
jgi:methyl-accepting chemotaxis protein